MEKGRNVRKTILIVLLSLAVVCAIFVGVGVVAKRANATTVKVIPVIDLNQSGFSSDGQSLLYGEVTSSVTQKVELVQDTIISQVYVKVGDRVKPGDRLLTYDMTLKQLELELMKLQKQELENKLAQSRSRLESLENGGPIVDPRDDYTPMDDEDDSEAFYSPYLRAFSQLPLQVMDAVISGPQVSEDQIAPEAPILYELLDYDSVPYQGTGSEEDPYCFLCTGSDEGVIVKGSFFNKMAGYDETGTQKEGEACWYRLEFHEDDRVADPEDPGQSLKGYYVRQGKEVFDPDEEKTFTLEGAGQTDDGETVLTATPEAEVSGPNPEVEETKEPDDEDEDDWDDEDWEDDWDDDYEEPIMSREEAIKLQRNNIQAYELDIQKKALAISKMEKELKNETVTSIMEGVVTVVGDPQTGESDGEGFIEIESDDGYYVKGALGELMLDRMEEGDLITGMAYESGVPFTAEIREIAIYPSSGQDSYFTTGMENPNVSYYPFIAHVTEDLDLENGENAELQLDNTQEEEQGAIYLEAAMLRSEGGQYYVYKDDGGKLKKQFVTAKKSSDGFWIVVTKGLSNDDKIAFPYGSGVEDGVKTEDGTLDELYAY